MPTIDIDRLIKQADMQPSFACAVCGKPENPKADIVRGEFWLCPECLAKLRMLIREDGDGYE